jgi:uncharacterized protein (TIGR02996 family)
MIHDAFLQDICENPEDDTPRLIYADWLEDNGTAEDLARAEFIRAQIERAHLPPDGPRAQVLRRREQALLGQYEASWRAALPHLDGITWHEDFERGFVQRVLVSVPGAFLRDAATLFAAAPVLAARFRGVTDRDMHPLTGSRHLARLNELHLGDNHLSYLAATFLVNCPPLANLTTLFLYNNVLGDGGALVLASGRFWARLGELYLFGNGIGDAGVLALAESPHLPALHTLDLRDNAVGTPGVRALAGSSRRANLVTLFLVNNRIDDEGARALADSPHLPRLANLYLDHNPIGDAGAVALAQSPRRAGLRELDLRSCNITSAGARALAGSPHLDNLRLLALTGNHRIDNTAVRVLRDRFGERVRV